MLLFTCDGSGVDSFTDEQLSGAECLTGTANRQDPKLRCLGGNLVAAWAVGGTVSGISSSLSDVRICIYLLSMYYAKSFGFKVQTYIVCKLWRSVYI